MLPQLKVFGLFVATALAEITGCYLPHLWLTKRGPAWLLLPAAASLILFVWLLSLHPTAAGRVYAAYGGVYVAVALAWLWLVDRVALTAWDVLGASVSVLGMAIIMFAPRSSA
ncbi:MAG: YnfA family protein [Betaproteobacteria bacterium]|nr:YnfA family protein [Betaproteobacteria bacterium]